MPLSGVEFDLGLQNKHYMASLNLVSILCHEEISKLFSTKNQEFERLVYAYPGIPTILKPRHAQSILTYCIPKAIKNLLDQFNKFENYMIALGKRDHMAHQFETFVIGLHLLKKLLRKCPSKVNEFGFDNEEEIYRTWLFTAIGHDFGYPSEISEELLNELSGIYDSFYLESVSKNLASAVKNINSSKLDNKLIRYISKSVSKSVFTPFMNYLSKLDYKFIQYLLTRYSIINTCFDCSEFVNKSIIYALNNPDNNLFSNMLNNLYTANDHGIFSALLTTRISVERYIQGDIRGNKTIDEFLRSDESKMLSYAAGAIGIHNTPDLFSYISFDNNPYAYVLALLDNLQDWNRKLFDNTKYPDYILTGFDSSDEYLKIDIMIFLQDWTIDKIEDISQKLVSKKSLLENEIKSADPKKGIRIDLTYKTNLPQQLSDFVITINI